VTGASFDHLLEGYTRNPDVRLRLAVMGAPGSGKSTVSAGLLYFAKLFFFKVDMVPEVAKWHIYKKSDFSAPDFELKKFQEQWELENLYPRELEILICEAPLPISAVYSAYYLGEDHSTTKRLLDLAEETKHRYTHYFVSRKLVQFEAFGRNETEEQSNALHYKTLEILERLGLNYTIINRYDEHLPLQVLSMVGAISKKGEDNNQLGLGI
jgi:ABC-type dipeptide/oligopeptide/nickel transport system ATPase subunit